MDKALVLFSGGQDSATCLAWALKEFELVETIGFDYGQNHKIELETRLDFLEVLIAKFPNWKSKFGGDRIIDMSFFGNLSNTSLTKEKEIIYDTDGLPNTFVPGRNLMFFTIAGAVGYQSKIRHLIGGMCETDFSGYPDCRDNTMKSLQVTLNLGMDSNFVIHTPLMWINKAQTWKMAEKLGGKALIQLIVEHTHTCYTGNRTNRHEWGYGCANCPACDLRAKGFKEYSNN